MILLPLQRLVAQGDLFDERAWIIIIVAIASALRQLLKKRRADQRDAGEQPSRPSRRAPTGTRGPRQPSPRTPQPRPARVPPARPIPEPVEVAGRPRPSVLAPPPGPLPSGDDPERARTMRAQVEARQAYEVQRQPGVKVPAQGARPRRLETAVHAEPALRERLAGVAQAQLERLLTDRSGAATAILASEILGPPLALRERQF